ncbi:MAG: hypothetical protein R3D84_01730 [Paracoccaceae bacterium]
MTSKQIVSKGVIVFGVTVVLGSILAGCANDEESKAIRKGFEPFYQDPVRDKDDSSY